MTDPERGLLAAVCESPDDDTPRLILADWYDEHGQPDRAGFIRAQIELDRLVAEEAYDTDEYLAASRAVSRLPNEAFIHWLREAGVVPAIIASPPSVDIRGDAVTVREPVTNTRYVFHRGFVGRVWMRVDHVALERPFQHYGLPITEIEFDTTWSPPNATPVASADGFLVRHLRLSVGRDDHQWRGVLDLGATVARRAADAKGEIVRSTRQELFTDLHAWLHQFVSEWAVGVQTDAVNRSHHSADAVVLVVNALRASFDPHLSFHVTLR